MSALYDALVAQRLILLLGPLAVGLTIIACGCVTCRLVIQVLFSLWSFVGTLLAVDVGAKFVGESIHTGIVIWLGLVVAMAAFASSRQSTLGLRSTTGPIEKRKRK